MFLYLDFRCYFEANGPNYTDSFSVKGTLEFRYVGAHPGKPQHGVSIQMSISLGKTFLGISRIQKISSDLNLGEGLCICTSFISQILDFIY